MAQVSIREYDVKTMLYSFLWTKYTGIQIKHIRDIEKLKDATQYVIKPDMLFGKRGKRWLLWLNLTKEECKSWFLEHENKSQDIDGVLGTLDVFMAERFIQPQTEYYVSFSLGRDGDTLIYSSEWGVDIEENWEKTHQITIPVSQNLEKKHLEKLEINIPELSDLIEKLWSFYRSHGFTSLEFNPIAQDASGDFFILDAVAKIDDSEWFRQKQHWKTLEIPNTYGFQENAGEKYIRELDIQTGASLKLKILNPEAHIWTLFAGGGGSLVMTDSLGALWYSSEIWNYGECSGNPSREFTREYTKTLLSEMLSNQKKWKYLIIAGAIANFTHVDKTFLWVIDALEIYEQELKSQQVTILVRRWGINEKKWLQLLQEACNRLDIPAIITGSDTYMTDILREITL